MFSIKKKCNGVSKLMRNMLEKKQGNRLQISKGEKGLIGCLAILIYAGLFLICPINSPEFMLMSMLPPIVVVLLLLQHTPRWVKVVVLLVLFAVGIYELFYNDIKGPLEFFNIDRPVSAYDNFHGSWRYYWIMCYLNGVAWKWGLSSVFFLLCYKIWNKWFKG